MPSCPLRWQAFSSAGPVNFIEIVPDSLLAYVRFDSAEAATRGLNVRSFGKVSLVEGEAERQFWARVAAEAAARKAMETAERKGAGGKGGKGRGKGGGDGVNNRTGGGKGEGKGKGKGKGKGDGKGKSDGKGKGKGGKGGGRPIKERPGTVSF